jgi:hypothetical protein
MILNAVMRTAKGKLRPGERKKSQAWEQLSEKSRRFGRASGPGTNASAERRIYPAARGTKRVLPDKSGVPTRPEVFSGFDHHAQNAGENPGRRLVRASFTRLWV